MIKHLKKVFILTTTAVDVYVFACIAIGPKWTAFGISLAPEYWFIAGIAMSLIILIYFLMEIYRDEMAYKEHVSEILACHQVEIGSLWEEVKYVKNHALILDS